MTEVSQEFRLERFLTAERIRVDAALERAVGSLLPHLPVSLRGPVEQGVLAGGKRLRPILCVTGYQACMEAGESAQEGDAIYDLAVSVELIHAYSLMHDDLPCMDDAPLRRGRPTPHTLHGERATVLAGAALIPAAALQAWQASERLSLSPSEGKQIVRTLCRAAGAGGMVGGQALDLLGEGQRLSREALDGLHRRKTGALLKAALVIGATAARAPREASSALERYGQEIGLAFQVADDVLDATADAATLGKEPSDRELDKSTYVALLGVEGARQEAETRVELAIGALREARIDAPPLEALARYVVARDR